MGNTTSPATDLAMAALHFDELDFILEQYSKGTFPFQMCPPALFVEIIKINHLRMQATTVDQVESLTQQAYHILSNIDRFSSDKWAESKLSSREDWILVGSIYQTAVAIYCISSLQSLSILPMEELLQNYRTAYGQTLNKLLAEALRSSKLKRFMTWPLVVLGMEAVNSDWLMRSSIEKQLVDLSCHMGTFMPLTAKAVLQRFWKSSRTGWDACFDKPNVFVSPIAVDMSRILPL
jgi:hypothetical protein